MIAVDAAEPHHQTVRRRALDQFLHRIAAQTPRHDQRGIFREGAGIAEIGDVLARGALTRFAASRRRIGTRFVGGETAAVIEVLQILADVIEVDVLGGGVARTFDMGFFDEGERRVFEHRVARRDGEFA